MSGWDVTTEDWRAWALEDDPPVAPLERVDDFDDSLREQLEKARFPSGDETTLLRPNPTAAFDSMTTLIREAPKNGASPDAATVVTPHPEAPPLTVDLVAPAGDRSDLEITLRAPSREEPAASPPSPPASELRALIDDDSVDEAEDDAAEKTKQKPEAKPEAEDDEELFIPSLTKAAPAKAEPLPPPPDLSFDEATAPEAIGVTDAWERRASGELGLSTVQAEPEPPPPPRRRVEVSLPDASTSQTSGVIQMLDRKSTRLKSSHYRPSGMA